MRQSPDTYFVRMDPGPPSVGSTALAGRAGLGAPGKSRRRRRRRPRGRAILLLLLLGGLGSWTYWASQRPGGVSGTIDSWISHERTSVARVSSDPDITKAREYFKQQYEQTGQYPQLGENDLTTLGIGVGVTVSWCGPQAVVLQGASGAGTSSRLLMSGKDLGELPDRYACPASLTDPSPWKLKK